MAFINSSRFLGFTGGRGEPLNRAIPVIEPKLCTGCGECVSACEAHAIEVRGEKAIIDYERCSMLNGRDCRACVDICPREAITVIE
jgi:MinD superfamily P-loop ATPase